MEHSGAMNTVVDSWCGLDTGLAGPGCLHRGYRKGIQGRAPLHIVGVPFSEMSEVGLEVGQRKRDSSTTPGLAGDQRDQPRPKYCPGSPRTAGRSCGTRKHFLPPRSPQGTRDPAAGWGETGAAQL